MTTNKDTVLITGASTGIGPIYAERFARRGHNLIIVGYDFQELEAQANRLWAAHGVNVEIEVADLASPADVARIEDRLRSDSRIGVLVNTHAALAGFDRSDLVNIPPQSARVETLPNLSLRHAARRYLDREVA